MPQTLSLLSYVLLGLVLCTAAAWDVKTGKVPNWLLYPAILAGFLLTIIGRWLTHGQADAWLGAKEVCFAFFVALVPFLIIFAAGGLGGGDVKLMATVGAISASWQVVLGTAVYAFIVGLLMALAVMIRRGIIRQTLGRVWSAMLTVAVGVKPVVPTDSPRLPFCLGICLGGLLSGAEQLLKLKLPWSEWFS